MSSSSPVFEWGDWTFEPAEWRLVRASTLIPLPNKTLELLGLLLDRAPALVSKDDILAVVWRNSVVEEGNIAFHIAMLRKTLDVPGAGSCIETVRGRGYRFVAPAIRRTALEPRTPIDVPRPIEPAAPAIAVTPAPDTTPARPRASSPAAARLDIVRLWPAALLAIVVGVLGWLLLANLDTRVREVVVLPARDTRSATIEGVSDATAAVLLRDTTLRSRTAGWASSDETVIEAGHRLQAETVLTSIVDRSSDPWRVSVELTRTHDGLRLWNWVFDVPALVPAAGNAIGTRIASGLGSHLRVLLPSAGTGPKGESLVLALQAREQWRLRTPHSVQQAVGLYERAIAIDPAFARAYVGLADCYNLTMSGLPAGERYAKAGFNIDRALALAPDDAWALTSLAFYRYKFEWRWQDAESAFKRAIQADSSYALAHHWYGEFLGILGRYDEAIAELRRAQALEPNSLAIESDLVPPLLRSGRIAEARAVVEAAAATNPNWYWVPRRMSEVLAAEGRERESLEEQWRALVLSGASLAAVEALRAAYEAGGLARMLRLEISRLLATDAATPGASMTATNLSRAYARLGDTAEALRWTAIAIERREDAGILLLTLPDYDVLRGRPEFNRLLARVGFRSVASAR